MLLCMVLTVATPSLSRTHFPERRSSNMPSRSKSTGRTLEGRWRIIAKYKKNKNGSIRSIAKAANATWRKAKRWIRMYRKTGNVIDPATKPGPRVGSHRVVSTAALRAGVHAMEGMKGKSTTEVACDLGVSPNTVRREAHAMGLSYDNGKEEVHLTPKQRAGRLCFATTHAKAYRDASWRNVFWTDSSIFETGPTFRRSRHQNPKYWAKVGTHKTTAYTAHAQQVHVYGGVSRYGKSRLVFVTGTSNQPSKYARTKAGPKKGTPQDGVCGAEYLNDVLPLLYEDACAIFDRQGISRWVFQQDLASVHSGGISWLKGKNQRVVDDWPSKGMDINLIEHVWAKMGKALRTEYDPNRTFDEFKDLVKRTWESVCSRAYLEQLTDHPTTRLAEVVEMRGGMTKH
jgi:transposase